MNPRMLFRFIALVIAVMVVAAACGDDGDESLSTAPGADGDTSADGSSDDVDDAAGNSQGDATQSTIPATLGDSRWTLVAGSISDMPLRLLDSHQVTLEYADGTVSGTAACNNYSTTLMDGATVFDFASVTEMACDPPAAMELESTYLQALTAVTSVARDGDELVLLGDGVELRFAPVAAIPDADLEGTSWVLDTIVDGETASSVLAGTEPGIRFEDGTVSGSDGCNSFSAPYALNDGVLELGLMTSTTIGCPEDVAAQVAAISTVLGADPTVSIDGDRLTLTAGAGAGSELVYRAG